MDASWLPARYVLSGQLADRGALGTFAATDSETDRKVVLKALDARSRDSSLRLAFLRSHEQLSHVDLPFVPKVGPIQEGDKAQFFETEFMPGLPYGRAASARRDSNATLLGRLFSAISALHSCGEFHGNLKPRNVLFDADEDRLSLLDLGFWGYRQGEHETESSSDYWAPELRRTHLADVRSDFYGFGLLAFELLTGLRVNEEVLAGLCSRDRAGAREWLASLSNDLNGPEVDLIVAVTSPQLSARPQSCGELLELLRPVLNEREAKALPAPRESRFTLCPEFVGRGDVLERLLAATEEARRRGVGVAKLVGVAGSGKSRIAEEFLFECKQRGYRVARSVCLVSALSPYNNVLQLLETSAEQADEDRRKMLLATADFTRTELLKALKQPTGGGEPLCRLNPPEGIKTLQRKVLQAMTDLVKDEFWVFIVDDSHSMSEPVASLLDRLIRALAEKAKKNTRTKGGLLVFMTVPRNEGGLSPGGTAAGPRESGLAAVDALGGMDLTEMIDLEALDEESARLLVESTLGASKPLRAFASFLYDRFGGNPAWLAAGARLTCSQLGISIPVISKDARRLEALDRDKQSPAPERLAEALTDGLDEASSRLLDVVAILPGIRTVGLIESVLDAGNQRPIQRIDALCRKGILTWRCNPPSILVGLRHRLLKETCLNRISETQALEVSRRAAKYWEQIPSRETSEIRRLLNLKYHLAKSDANLESLEFLESLSAVFQTAGSYSRAIELLQEAISAFSANALALSDSIRREYTTRLHFRRGDLYVRLSDYDNALSDYTKALSSAQDGKRISDQCACKLRIAEIHRLRGELESALEVLNEAESMASAHEDIRNQALASHTIGKIHLLQGNFSEALRNLSTALKHAERTGDEAERGSIVHNLGSVFWAQGDYERARERFIQALKICEKAGDEHTRAIALNGLAATCAEQSDMAHAMQYFSEALSTFQRLGDRSRVSTILQNLASCLLEMGDIGASYQRIEQAISIKRLIGDVSGRSEALLARGEILREMGDYDGALCSHCEAFHELRSKNESLVSDAAVLGIALDHLEFGVIESAVFHLELLLRRKDETKPSTASSAVLALARASLDAGDNDRAVKLCNDALPFFEKQRRPIEAALCLITLSHAHTRARRLGEAADCLQRASSIVNEFNRPSLQFQLYWALGDYHIRSDNLTESYASYAQAASILEALAATLPGDRQELFLKKRSLSRFRIEWDAIRREPEEDAPMKTESDDLYTQSAAPLDPVAAALGQTGGAGLELTEACDIIISHLLTATPFERGCIAIRADSGRLKLTRALDRSGQVLDPKRLGGPESVSRHVNLTGTPVFTHRGVEKPDWLPDSDIGASVMCVALSGRRERLGAIYLDSPNLLEFSSDGLLHAVESLARLAVQLIENAVLREHQDGYIRELVDRTMLLAGARDIPPMLVPGGTAAPEKTSAFPEIIGASEQLLKVTREAARIVKTDVTVLVTGETGTGKELLAQAIHTRSLRKDAPFLVINCGAIPRDLVEAELFGFERGAFTGAHKQKRGRLEYGHKGTIFLDEIAELSLEMQVKLLRFLETKTIERVGGVEQLRIDCRIIAATNCDLETAVEDGSFREDLYYRLGVIHLELPPIRDRDDDVLRLANHFLSLSKEKYNKRRKIFSVRAVERMMHHRWPGNVRELQNKVEKAVLMSTGGTITDLDLGLMPKEDGQIERLKEVKDGVEVSRLKTALRSSGGNVAQAARMAGLSRQNFYRLLRKHDLSLDEYRPHGRS
ncbi:MAG: sigma 54-interacting transcriptional regulator [Candidatus Coatesbacteria bacterium]|nr:sigma 54-interacting transcriptional regulator [Candidatus Coatesbacteria bacterium]